MNKTAKKHCIIINVSGHPVPKNTIYKLKGRGYETYSMYNSVSEYNLLEDVWPQVEDTIKKICGLEDKWGKRLAENEGDYFICIPSLSVPAALLLMAFKNLLGFAPELLVITRVNKGPELTQILDVRAFEAKARTSLRESLLLTDKGNALI